MTSLSPFHTKRFKKNVGKVTDSLREHDRIVIERAQCQVCKLLLSIPVEAQATLFHSFSNRAELWVPTKGVSHPCQSAAYASAPRIVRPLRWVYCVFLGTESELMGGWKAAEAVEPYNLSTAKWERKVPTRVILDILEGKREFGMDRTLPSPYSGTSYTGTQGTYSHTKTVYGCGGNDDDDLADVMTGWAGSC